MEAGQLLAFQFHLFFGEHFRVERRFELEQVPEDARQFAAAVQRFHALQVVRPWYGSPLVMDKFWSIFAMPIGVALCFGPALIVWWLTKDKEAPSDDKSGKSH